MTAHTQMGQFCSAIGGQKSSSRQLRTFIASAALHKHTAWPTDRRAVTKTAMQPNDVKGS
jgi:hypothetical protein